MHGVASTVKEIDSHLLSAAEKNNIDVVSYAIQEGAGLSAKSSWLGHSGWNALHWAVFHNNADMVQLILQAGANKEKINAVTANPRFFRQEGE